MRFTSRVILSASLMLTPGWAFSEETLVPQVTLPLADYQKLKGTEPKPAATVLDRLRLMGSFQGRDLNVLFEGRSVGTRPAVTVLHASDGLAPYGCRGDGLLTRDQEGAFVLTPLSSRFQVACRLGVPSVAHDRVRFTAAAAVLWVESSVKDGELLFGEENSEGRDISLVRHDPRENVALRTTVTGRYRVTLDPEETPFRYELTFRNPNRSHQPFDVALSGEEVQQVQGAAGYNVQGDVLRVELPPGDSTVIVSGVLKGSSFTPPIEASLQYVLLESHPLIKADVPAGVRRVSPAEVGIPMQYRGGEAFLLKGRERLEWKVSRLEALPVPSLAVRHSHQRIFVPREGPLFVEREVTIENQGASELVFDVKEPVFASIAGAPVPLTEHDGKLSLPLAEGPQQLVLQERRGFRQGIGFGYGTLSAPFLPVTPTVTSLEVRTAADWLPLYAQMGSMKWMWAPQAVSLIWGILLFAALERAVAGLGLTRRIRVPLAGALAVAALTSAGAFTLIGWTCAFAGILWLAGRVPIGKWNLRNVVGAFVLVTLCVLLAAHVISKAEREWAGGRGLGSISATYRSPSLLSKIIQGPFVPDAPQSPDNAAFYAQEAPPPASRAQEKEAGTASSTGSPMGGYRGLPVRALLPQGSSRMSLGVEMLPTTNAVIRLLVVSVAWVLWLKILVLATAAFLVFLSRREILDGIRRQADRVRQSVAPRPAATAVASTT